MGLKSRNQVNRAYKSTNTENVEIFNDVLSKLPSCNSSKMNNNQLKESIERFRTGDLNVLIATNVVEEGLDVSSCNQIICLNELFNVKQYI